MNYLDDPQDKELGPRMCEDCAKGHHYNCPDYCACDCTADAEAEIALRDMARTIGLT